MAGFLRKVMQRLAGEPPAPAAATASAPATACAPAPAPAPGPVAPAATPAEWRQRGNTALGEGRLDEAVASYRQAVRADSQDPLSHLNLGYALLEQSSFAAAAAALQQAVGLARPGDDFLHDAQFLLGRAASALGDLEQALASFQAAVAARPGFVEALLELAQLQVRLGRPAQALVAIDKVLAQQPEHADALEGRGTVLLALSRPAEALAAFEAAHHPPGANNLSNRGAALSELGRYDEALVALDHALAQEPAHAGALYNKGYALSRLLRVRESLAVSQEGRRLDPENADLAWNCAVAHLLLGEFTPGWQLFESRHQATALGTRSPAPRLAARVWSGQESLQDRSIVLHAEQGLGDTIQFLRFVPEVARRAGRVLLRVQAPLAQLAAGLADNCVLLAPDEMPAGMDLQCSLMSLPLALRVTEESLPGPMPYLRADRGRTQAWRERLATQAPGLRVGIAWSGNPGHRNDLHRSLPFASLAPLALPGVSLVTIQPKLPPEFTHVRMGAAPLLRCGDELADFTDTAALLAALDLVICVDTSVAHLAGALGCPVWILLPYCPDWRWLLERGDTPWYPSARLFRQPAEGDWSSVMAVVARELAARAGEERPATGL